MINIKPLDAIQKKFAQRAQAAGPAYAEGVANPRRPWAASAKASSDAWSQGVQTAIQNGRFTKGIDRAGDAKWSANAAGVGAQRYPTGAAAAAPAYGNGFSAYLTVLSNLSLPPRFPRGDPRNNDRVSAVTAALHAKKVSG